MGLNIETFSNLKGGNSFFKAVGHPLAADPMRALVAQLAGGGPVAVYDPLGLAEGLAELYDLRVLRLAGVYAQDLTALGRQVLGREIRPVTELIDSGAAQVFVVAFDAHIFLNQIKHLVPERAEVLSLDAVRLPEPLLSNPRRYLDPLNFATNFALFRDAQGLYTRLVTANYWAGYGAKDAALWLSLFDADGQVLAQWQQALTDAVSSIVIDSRELRRRFDLPEFTGSLFLHAVRIAGHDVVKYALDTYGDDPTVLSCTHDANAWPADLYAGLPAPAEHEQVILWVQNSHPCPISRQGLGLNLMGSSEVAWLDREVPPFGTIALDVAELLPDARWPQQLEVQAGRYFVRPRYEILHRGRRRIAHTNVERTDLKPDPQIARFGPLLGKGYLLPAPVLPLERYRTTVLPTPMSTCQEVLPIQLAVYAADGRELACQRYGSLTRRDSVAIEVAQVLEAAGAGLTGGYGHVELMYDPESGDGIDGWLHAIFRYEDRHSGHIAETSFGAHVYNTVLTYRDEPQSYAGRPPGLTTRLFLRLGSEPTDTLCHLIYPASMPWHPQSSTSLYLYDPQGQEIACKLLCIPCGGSLLWRYSEMFGSDERRRAGQGAYVVVRDASCRLFGYHGLLNGEVGKTAFCLDHMFGF